MRRYRFAIAICVTCAVLSLAIALGLRSYFRYRKSPRSTTPRVYVRLGNSIKFPVLPRWEVVFKNESTILKSYDTPLFDCVLWASKGSIDRFLKKMQADPSVVFKKFTNHQENLPDLYLYEFREPTGSKMGHFTTVESVGKGYLIMDATDPHANLSDAQLVAEANWMFFHATVIQ